MQFPHMIFWTETGLISKILIKAGTPSPQFWLNQNQLSQLNDGKTEIEFWKGQDEADDPVISGTPGTVICGFLFDVCILSFISLDSESEDEETKAKRLDRENFGIDDIKEAEGVLLIVDKVDSCSDITLSRKAAEEYQPGGELLIALETFVKPVAEVFGSVVVRDSRYECYSTTSGSRIGSFEPSLPTPGEQVLQDSLGLKPPFRIVPPGMYKLLS